MVSPPHPSPLLEGLRRCFAAAGDPSISLWQQQYMRNQFLFFGIKTPHRRQLQRTLFVPELLPATVEELEVVVAQCWEEPQREMQYAALDLLTFPEEHSDTMEEWIHDQDLWIRRSALLSQLTFKQTTNFSLLCRHILHCAHEKEFFIRKAIGWALREYARWDASAVRDFVEEHSAKLSPLSKREALKRCGLSSRRRRHGGDSEEEERWSHREKRRGREKDKSYG